MKKKPVIKTLRQMKVGQQELWEYDRQNTIRNTCTKLKNEEGLIFESKQIKGINNKYIIVKRIK